jgi:hypothetical protein
VKKILETKEFALELAKLISSSKNSICILSAYLTLPGISWLLERLPEDVQVKICVRLSISDVFKGATDLSALRLAINAGCIVSMHRALHAKIYVFDRSDIMLGSANLTGNGLCIHSAGNLEIGTYLKADNHCLELVDKVVSDAVSLNSDDVDRLEEFVSGHYDQDVSILPSDWPDGLVDISSGIWVADFPWEPFSDGVHFNQHDQDLFGIAASPHNNIGLKFCSLPCLHWLKRQLNSKPEKSMFFGELSQCLHDELMDDPAPYRKGVKSLLQNLLTFCASYPECGLVIDRPNYSQRISIR